MAKIYEDEPTKYKKGRLLAQGHGVFSMGDVSYKNKWSNNNTILEVSNPNDLDSKWRIYERTAIAKDIDNVKKKTYCLMKANKRNNKYSIYIKLPVSSAC